MRTERNGASGSTIRTIRGQGLTEYIVILALIAIAAVVSVSFFGTAVKTQFVALSSELVGGDGASAIKNIEDGVEDATGKATTAATLKTYTDN